MKRISLAIILLALSSIVAGAQEYYDYRDRYLPSRKRTETTLHVVFPMYFGVSALVQPTTSSLLPDISKSDVPEMIDMLTDGNFLFSMEMAHLSFTSKGTPFEADLGLRCTLLNSRKMSMSATYLGVPLRFGVAVGRKGKIFVGTDAEVLMNGRTSDDTLSLYPYRVAAEAGISFGFLGLWASYGLTPLFSTGSDARLLTFGIVIEA